MTRRLSYGDLTRTLKDLGFRQESTEGDHLLFRNEPFDATIVLPLENPSEELRRQHLIATRRLLVERGVVSQDAFDRLLSQQTLSKAS
jgi:predicted RNA binding protein YcfA (HicA-like mRNA interferase family)